MLWFLGRRAYGRIDAYGDEHAHTRFANVYFLPLFPVGSFWVTHGDASGANGFPIPMSGKSVAAAYLRIWGPIAVIAACATGRLDGLLAGVMLAAAMAWSWSWRDLRGATARKQSDLQMLAFGTRCAPRRMSAEMRASFKRALDERWAKLELGHSPDDVAAQGAKSATEAAIAYGLLALAAIDASPAERARAAEAAKRILAGTRDDLAKTDGPYRDTQGSAVDAALSDAELARAAAEAKAAQIVLPAPPRVTRWAALGRSKVKSGLLLAVLAVYACALVGVGWAELRPHQVTTAAELAQHGESGSHVEVTCTDELTFAAQFSTGALGWACPVGDKLLLVIADLPAGDHAPAGTVIAGELHSLYNGSKYIWPSDVRTIPNVAPVFLEEQSRAEAWGLLLAGALGLPFLMVLVVRNVRRAQRLQS